MSMQANELGRAVREPWRRFLAVYEPLRPDLYRYCRYLTRSPWDAEDLAQDALARAFVTLACTAEAPHSPRAWLFRVASNLWLNKTARAGEVLAEGPEPSAASEAKEPRASREAAGTLLVLLSPQERASVVLKDVFDFSLEEIADTLCTTAGAVKTALYRGRGKLAAPEPEEAPVVAPTVLDEFCAAFDAGDLDRLTALLLDTVVVEVPGLVVEFGAEMARAGTFRGTLRGCPESDAALGLVGPPRSEVRMHRGEPILLWWWGDAVRSVLRVEVQGGRIARIRNYFHAPELLLEVCGELGLPVRSNGHHPLVRRVIMKHVRSADGTRIAFDESGSGPPVILVGGAFCDRHARASGTPLAAVLSQFRVFCYDRRGRGDSTDSQPWAVDREVEDLAAVLAEAGGRAAVYGMSSGAILALEAASRGLSISKLALYEPPMIISEARPKPPVDLAAQLGTLCEAGELGDAAELFLLAGVGLPPFVIANMRKAPVWAGLVQLAPTLRYDAALTADPGAILARAARVSVPTCVMVGGESPAWMREGASALAAAIPGATQRALVGQTHDVALEPLARALGELFA